MKRGIIYIVWDSYNKSELQRSIKSAEGYDVEVIVEHSDLQGLAKKSRMGEVAPFDVTLFLDTDTEIKGDISYGFDMAEKYGLAVCHAPACSAAHAGPMGKELKALIPTGLPQLNTGVIFFRKDRTKELFSRWRELCEQYPESAKNDQITFSLAVHEWGNPYILSRMFNYRSKIRYSGIPHGPVIINHAR